MDETRQKYIIPSPIHLVVLAGDAQQLAIKILSERMIQKEILRDAG